MGAPAKDRMGRLEDEDPEFALELLKQEGKGLAQLVGALQAVEDKDVLYEPIWYALRMAIERVVEELVTKHAEALNRPPGTLSARHKERRGVKAPGTPKTGKAEQR